MSSAGTAQQTKGLRVISLSTGERFSAEMMSFALKVFFIFTPSDTCNNVKVYRRPQVFQKWTSS